MAKKKQNNKTFTLSFLFNVGTIILVALLGLLAAVLIVFATLWGKTRQSVYLVLLIVLSLALLIAFGVAMFFITKLLRRYYMDGLFKITLTNYHAINHGKTQLTPYPVTFVEEFSALNEEIDKLNVTFKNISFAYAHSDYSNLELERVEGLDDVITYASFQKQLTNIIANAMSFRNLLVEVYYEIGEETLSNEEINKFVKEMRKKFASFPNTLCILAEDRTSFYFFIPRIDSLSVIQEKLTLLMPALAINKHTMDGFVSLPAHFSVVCYPFSSLHELLSDLRYAKRQGKLAAVYLPNRIHYPGPIDVGRNAMYLNQMSKILFNLRSLNADSANKEEIRQGIAETLTALTKELRFESAGIVAFGQEEAGFAVLDHVGSNKPFSMGMRIEDDIMAAISASEDSDHSFYFSSRDHVTIALGRACDRFGISSGFFYSIVREGKKIGFIFFVNTSGDHFMDSYLKEALTAACYHISSSFVIGRVMEGMVESNRLLDSFLAYEDAATYQVERGSFRIVSYSSNFPRVVGMEPPVGEVCHRAFFGLATPCRGCPLVKGNRRTVQINGQTYSVSMTMDAKRGVNSTLLLKRINEAEEGLDRYDHDLLINSFYSLLEEAKKHYLVGDKGYILLLQVANHVQLLERFGSEGLLLVYRNFLEKIKGMMKGAEQIYAFDSQTFGLFLPNDGQIDVLNTCEVIFTFTKGITYQGEDKYDLQLNYRPMSYPSSYATANDFFRHVYRQLKEDKRVQNGKDIVYFDDTDYVRPASRREFILSVIDEQFGKETFRVSLQPMVRSGTKKIYGAEILLRIQDEYRHIVFNPDELVRVAEENGKIPLITRALLRYVANFYQNTSAKVLDDMGFIRISLNTEVSLFTDPSFADDLASFIKTARLPNEFLSFEIPEKDASDRFEECKRIVKILRANHSEVVIDQYTGRFLSLDRVLELGIHDIKVSRNLVTNIDSDQRKLKDIKALLDEAKAKGISATVVGVENIDQYNLLHQINPKLNLQGYYFYRPLERDALIDALRSNRSVG